MASAPGPGTARQLSLIACIAVCMLGPLSGLTQAGLPPVLPKIGAHFSDVPNAEALVRLMMTGLSAAMIAGALASGFLAERFGQVRLLHGCLAVYALTGVASYLVDNLYFMIAMRVVLGAANAAAGVVATAIIATRLDGVQRDRWLGYYITFGTVFTTVWVGLAGVLGAIDWRLIFLLQLVAVPAALFVGLTLTGDPPRQASARAVADAGGGIPWGMTLFGLGCGAIGPSVFAFLPFHLQAIGLGDPATIGPMLTLSMGAGVVTTLSFGWIRARLAAMPVFLGGFAFTALGLFIALATSDFAVITAGLAIYGAGFGVITPNIFSACAAATPMALRTRVLGFMRAGYYAGPLAFQPVLEVASRTGGPGRALAMVALGALVAAGLFLVFRARFAPVPEPAAA